MVCETGRPEENTGRGDKMTKMKAMAIFKNIHDDEIDPEDKLTSISEILDMETHNSITKQELLGVLKWLIEEYI